MAFSHTETEVLLTFVVYREDEDALFERILAVARKNGVSCRNQDAFSGLFLGTEESSNFEWSYYGDLPNIQGFLADLSLALR